MEIDKKAQEVVNRLRSVLKEKKINGREFSAIIGLQITSGSKTLTGKTSLTKPLANSIELRLGYRAEWLLTGEGTKLANPKRFLSAEDQALLAVAKREGLVESLEAKILSRLSKQLYEKQVRMIELMNVLITSGSKEGEQLAQRIAQEAGTSLKLFDDFKQGLDANFEVLKFKESLIQALYFGEAWEEMQERSKAWEILSHLMQSKEYPHLKAQFESTFQRFQKLESQLAGLFTLSPKEVCFLTKAHEGGLDPLFPKEVKFKGLQPPQQDKIPPLWDWMLQLKKT